MEDELLCIRLPRFGFIDLSVTNWRPFSNITDGIADRRLLILGFTNDDDGFIINLDDRVIKWPQPFARPLSMCSSLSIRISES